MARKHEPVPALEWAAASFGLLLVVALLAIIGRGALVADENDVPLLVASVERVFATPTGHVVEIAVANRSSVTAASVQLEGTVGDETSIASIDYVPGNSRATGGLVFSSDPKAEGVQLRVTGYELP